MVDKWREAFMKYPFHRCILRFGILLRLFKIYVVINMMILFIDLGYIGKINQSKNLYFSQFGIMEVEDNPKTLASFSNDDGILNGLEFPQDVEEALKEVKETLFTY